MRLSLLILLLAAATCITAQECSGHGTSEDGVCVCDATYFGPSCNITLDGSQGNCLKYVSNNERLMCVDMVPQDCDLGWAVQLVVSYSGAGLVSGQWLVYSDETDVSDLCTSFPSNEYWTVPGGPHDMPEVALCLDFADISLDTTTVSANTTFSYTVTDPATGDELDSLSVSLGRLSGTNAPCGEEGYIYGACSVSYVDEAEVFGDLLTWNADDNCVYRRGWPLFCPAVVADTCSVQSGAITTARGANLQVPLAGGLPGSSISCDASLDVCLNLDVALFNDTTVSYSFTVSDIAGDNYVAYPTQTATFPACGEPLGPCREAAESPYAVGSNSNYVYYDDDGADDDDNSNPDGGVYLAFLLFFGVMCIVFSLAGVAAFAFFTIQKKRQSANDGYGLVNEGSRSLLEDMDEEGDAMEI